jgi:hypothetical protein
MRQNDHWGADSMKSDYPDLVDVPIDDKWAASEGDLDGKPMLVRIRQNLRPLAGHPQLPHRLRIVWEYEPENQSGIPSRDELQRMEDCEGRLVDALERHNHAVLTHVLLCDGLRQWVFYSSDLEETARRINDVLPHDEPYPIELTADPDPVWSEYLDTLRTLGL